MRKELERFLPYNSLGKECIRLALPVPLILGKNCLYNHLGLVLPLQKDFFNDVYCLEDNESSLFHFHSLDNIFSEKFYLCIFSNELVSNC